MFASMKMCYSQKDTKAAFRLQATVTQIRYFCSYVTQIRLFFNSVNSPSHMEPDLFQFGFGTLSYVVQIRHRLDFQKCNLSLDNQIGIHATLKSLQSQKL